MQRLQKLILAATLIAGMAACTPANPTAADASSNPSDSASTAQ
jgi:hypothetical protein